MSIPEIGDETVDAQHNRLLEQLLNLKRSTLEKADHVHLTNILSDLSSYVIEHFAYEETLMEEIGYPDLESHKAKHKVFEQKIEEALVAQRLGSIRVSINLIDFLKNWIVNHINKEDKAISNFLRQS